MAAEQEWRIEQVVDLTLLRISIKTDSQDLEQANLFGVWLKIEIEKAIESLRLSGRRSDQG